MHVSLETIVMVVGFIGMVGGWFLSFGVLKSRIEQHQTFILTEFPATRSRLEARLSECVTTREFAQALARLNDIRTDIQAIQHRVDAWDSTKG